FPPLAGNLTWRVVRDGLHPQPASAVSAVLFPRVAKPPTFPQVRQIRRSLWSAILKVRRCFAYCTAPVSAPHFPISVSACRRRVSIVDRDWFASTRTRRMAGGRVAAAAPRAAPAERGRLQWPSSRPHLCQPSKAAATGGTH